jgi:hypothetical protein
MLVRQPLHHLSGANYTFNFMDEKNKVKLKNIESTCCRAEIF